MSESTNLDILLILTPLVVIYLAWMAYTANRAFKIRKSVLIPTHRYQALWVGGSAIYWMVSIFIYFLVPYLYILFPEQVLAAKTALALLAIAGLYFGLIFVFAWTDAIIPIARASDPHNRNTLQWQYSRVVIWMVLAIGIALGGYFVVPMVLGNSGTGLFGPAGLGVLFYADVSPFFLLIGVITILVLLISYNRSADQPLRRHLKWLITYIAVLSIQGSFAFVERSNIFALTGNIIPSSNVVATIFGFLMLIAIAEAFCLFRCVQSLTLINRFPPKELPNPRPLD